MMTTRASAHSIGPHRLAEVALEYADRFRDDATAQTWHHFAEVPDRRARLEVVADAYGHLGGGTGRRSHRTPTPHLAHVHELAERGLEPQATWARDGTVDESRRVAA